VTTTKAETPHQGTTIAKRTRTGTGGPGIPQAAEQGPSLHADPHDATQTGDEEIGGAEAEADQGPQADLPSPQPGAGRDPDLCPRTPKAEATADEEPAIVPKAEGETEAPTTEMSYAN
jgi:hypothetical protein